MKKYILLFLSIIGSLDCFSQSLVESSYYKHHPELGGDAVISKSTRKVDGNKTSSSFEISVSESGLYYANFWILGSRLKDGSYTRYTVEVNGKKVDDELVTYKADWQALGFAKKTRILLNSGLNIISVIGSAPDIPEVEFVKVSKESSDALISSEAYDTYIRKIRESSQMVSVRDINNSMPYDTLDTSSLSSLRVSYDPPLYDYQYSIGVHTHYTFYKTITFTANQQVTISTSANTMHYLELFSVTSPESYSWSKFGFSSGVTLTVQIPQSGMYYVKLRTYWNATSGLANLNINNEYNYSDVPIYSMGYVCTQGTDQPYNTFTCYNTGDPRLWISEYGTTEIVTAFNDDYNGEGDHTWTNNARINKTYPRTVNAVMLTTYSSYSPDCVCDLYMRCKNNDVYTSFENLEPDDCINSAPESDTYNCISWSGGITSYWEWPLDPFSAYYSSDDLTAFDNFYASRGLTRIGATESNSIVDLWANVSGSSREYTHGSVKKGADPNAHGYSWESKPGSLARTFHPRYSLNGSSYGQVVEHYIKASNTSSLMTLEEEIANGNKVLENVQFSDSERIFVESRIMDVPIDLQDQFTTKLNAWKEEISESPQSSFDKLASLQSYKSLLKLCQTHPNLMYMAYEQLGQGNIFITKIIEDVVLPNHPKVLDAIKADNEINSKTLSGVEIIRSPYSNVMKFVKKILNESGCVGKASENTKYSNEDSFTISHTDNVVSIHFSVQSESKVSIVVSSLNGMTSHKILNNKTLIPGNYNYSLALPSKGTYLVSYVLNGNVNVKKYVVE